MKGQVPGMGSALVPISHDWGQELGSEFTLQSLKACLACPVVKVRLWLWSIQLMEQRKMFKYQTDGKREINKAKVGRTQSATWV